MPHEAHRIPRCTPAFREARREPPKEGLGLVLGTEMVTGPSALERSILRWPNAVSPSSSSRQEFPSELDYVASPKQTSTIPQVVRATCCTPSRAPVFPTRLQAPEVRGCVSRLTMTAPAPGPEPDPQWALSASSPQADTAPGGLSVPLGPDTLLRRKDPGWFHTRLGLPKQSPPVPIHQ